MNLLDLTEEILSKAQSERTAADGGPAEGEPMLTAIRDLKNAIAEASAPKPPQTAKGVESTPFPLCRHVMPSGQRCRSPRLRGPHLYCYFHDRLQQRKLSRRQQHSREDLLQLPAFEDRAAITLAADEISRALVANLISERKAAVLLYALKIALLASTPAKQPAAPAVETDVAEDEELGEHVPLSEEELKEQAAMRKRLVEERMDAGGVKSSIESGIR